MGPAVVGPKLGACHVHLALSRASGRRPDERLRVAELRRKRAAAAGTRRAKVVAASAPRWHHVPVIVNYHPTWDDPASSWWAKANRAHEHLDSLRAQVDEFRASRPYSLTPEPTDVPERLAYRLKFVQPIPIRISTTVGDILSNLRASLESLAFEVARRTQGGSLTPEQESASSFPIKVSPDEFNDFFRGRKAALYDDRARRGFREVQPFFYDEMARQSGVTLSGSYEERARWHDLFRLDRLWNIDKHRRLAIMAWWPDLIYWGSDGPSNRHMLRGDGTVADGSILFYIQGRDEGMGDHVSHEFNLALTDDPGFAPREGNTDDVVKLLARWHGHVVNVVFPRVFTIMSPPAQSSEPASAPKAND
jgi:hypothetical protein